MFTLAKRSIRHNQLTGVVICHTALEDKLALQRTLAANPKRLQLLMQSNALLRSFLNGFEIVDLSSEVLKQRRIGRELFSPGKALTQNVSQPEQIIRVLLMQSVVVRMVNPPLRSFFGRKIRPDLAHIAHRLLLVVLVRHHEPRRDQFVRMLLNGLAVFQQI